MKAISAPPGSSVAALRHALQFATRAEDRTGDTERALAAAPASEDDEHARFKRAIASMHAAREADGDEARRYKESAIRELEALRALWAGTEQEGNAIVSLGNAFRIPPDEDASRAIATYEAASRLHIQDDSLNGKLHKVWCDALLELGGDAEARAAWEHVQIALAHRRTGYVRSETLFSAARAASHHPDWSETRRLMTSARLLTEAVQNDPTVSEPMLPRLIADLARWKQIAERDQERLAILDQLLVAYPQHRSDIERARLGIAEGPFGLPLQPAEQVADLIRLMNDPDYKVLHEVELALLPAEVMVDKVWRRRGTNPVSGQDSEPPDAFANLVAEHRKKNSTTGLKELLARPLVEGELGTAGARVANFMLLVELARRRESDLTDVHAALSIARAYLSQGSGSADFRVHALIAMADALSPVDTVADPVKDFDLATELAAEAVQLQGGEEAATRQGLTILGRALRYRDAGDATQNLRDARRLFARCVSMDRAAHDGEALAIDLIRLAELEGYLGEGDEVSRLKRSLVLEREAYEVAVTDGIRALAAENIAWNLTLIAGRADPADELPTYREALTWYARARSAWSPSDRNSGIENNEVVCRSDLALAEGRPAEAVAIWRERLRRLLENKAHPLDVAEAQHNLAEMLYRGGVTGDIEESIRIYREALRFRTQSADIRKHWQSMLGLGRALNRQIWHNDGRGPSAREEAREALRGAIAAARVLGPGRELAWASIELAKVACFESDGRSVELLASEAWNALREAMPYLLLHPESRIEEAQVAEHVAFVLANAGLREGILAPLPFGAALGRVVSERVLRWLLRAEAAYQRTLLARFRPPLTMGPTDRLAWQEALGKGKIAEVQVRLKAIHQSSPDWLRAELSLAETDRWLKQARGSLAIAVRPAQQGALVMLVDGDSGNRAALLLQGPVLPISEAELAVGLRDVERRARLLETLVTWAQQVILARVERFLGRVPKRLLWVPQGVLRLVPPSRLFPNSVVSTSASLALRASNVSRARSASAVVILADPDTPEAGLGPFAVQGAHTLAEALGGARLLVGVGARSGADATSTAVPHVPTGAQVMRELDHAGFAVLIAHGHMESEDDAWIELLKADGTQDRLDTARLLSEPGTIAGLSVVLLSCETGRAGAMPDRPGGIAGALLLAGAREVIAPLWPVSLHAAFAVGEALCRARFEGRDLAEALSVASRGAHRGGPNLGRPSPEVRAALAWDPAAFVIWVG